MSKKIILLDFNRNVREAPACDSMLDQVQPTPVALNIASRPFPWNLLHSLPSLCNSVTLQTKPISEINMIKALNISMFV